MNRSSPYFFSLCSFGFGELRRFLIGFVYVMFCTDITHDAIPHGRKQDVYCVVDNKANEQLRLQGKRSNFDDDCGVWESSGTTTTKFPYLQQYDGNGKLRLKRVFYRDNTYCYEKVVSGKRTYIPYNPQPERDSVITLCRYYTRQKHNPLFRKRVSYAIDSGRSGCAVVEYAGRIEQPPAHANNKCRQSEYVRTPAATMKRIREEVTTSTQPKAVYDELLQVFEEEDAPRDSRVVTNAKYTERKKTKNRYSAQFKLCR